MGNTSSEPEAVPIDLATLPKPYKRDDCMFFSVVPVEESSGLQQKGDVMILEVGSLGFRVLRPKTEAPLLVFPWGQIHSWAHGPDKFTFRYFDDGKRTILQHVVHLRDVTEILEHIQGIIDGILDERKTSGISPEAFDQLLERLKGTDDGANQLELVKRAISVNTFSSDQGREVMEVMPTTFDKVEAATVLHSRLIDQNRFCYMLEALDCQADRDNVWHRITLLKKQGSTRRKGTP